MKPRILALATSLFVAATFAHAASEMPSRVLVGPSEAPATFHASGRLPVDVASLPAPEKKAASTIDEQGRLRVATVRTLDNAAAVTDWASIPDGAVSTLRASSTGARGLRVSLDVGHLSTPLEIRAQGTDGRIEAMTVDPSREGEVWTPWTEGATQVIELFVPVGAPIPDARVTSVLHFDTSPFEKAAGACTVAASCTTGDGTLDNAIADRTKSSVRITFVENGSGFLCSATLINSDRFPIGYLLTANHCISGAASAASVSSFWFYDPVSCADVSLAPGMIQRSGGTLLTFTNYNADSTLLAMNETPPSNASYSGWSATALLDGESIVSLSHPKGDTTRLATGAITHQYRLTDRSQDEYGVAFNKGIIEGGSSGSGLFALSGGSLQLRGILTGTTVRNGSGGMSCTDLDEEALYGRFEIFSPQIAAYISGSGTPAADDAPNRVIDFPQANTDPALNDRTVTLDRSIERVGDVDVFRFTLTSNASVNVGTQGSLDTVGTLMDANGKGLQSNDDVAVGNLNFGITRTLAAGTYYVMVAPFDVAGTGAYRLVMSATTSATTSSDTNYTDLWWSQESGWGVNLAHQGDIIFATLYTYDQNGTPMWLYMSNGNKQSDGSFSGTLYRATGTPFNASSWNAASSTAVGTMTLSFSSASVASMTYTFNGISVSKTIRRFVYASPATSCTWTSGDRIASTNYQDLWWNPSESGWGVNIAHQGSTLFALLYIYDSNNTPLWLSMSGGALVGTRTYQGALYRAVGPAFNASPWTAANLTQVGTATFQFTDGETGTLSYTVNGIQVSKSIRRTVFSNPKPLCSPAG